MDSGTTFFDRVYDLEKDEAIRLYDEWAATYDEELRRSGYATPGRVAAALAESGAETGAPALDFGCGTGLSGLALKSAGFETVDGWDVSGEMLAEAREKGCYRKLSQIEPEGRMPAKRGAFSTVVAAGVLVAGHAPPETIDRLFALLDRGGRFGFSLNDHALADGRYMARVCEWVDCGAATVLFREHGPHLPEIDLESTVMVLQRR